MAKFFEHPEYKTQYNYWQTVADLYEGDHATMTNDTYLWRHEFESTLPQADGGPAEGYVVRGAGLLRAIRERRTRYINRLRAVLRRYVAILFVNELDTSSIESLFDSGEMDDVDGEGTSFADYLKGAADLYFRDGRVIGLVDSYNLTVRNRSEEISSGMRPFLSLISALEIKDWDLESQNPARRGKYNAFRNEYVSILPRAELTEAPVQKMYCRIHSLNGGRYLISRYVGPTLDEQISSVSDPDWTLEEETPVPQLTDMPIAVMESSRPLIADVIPLCLLRHNTQSSLDNGMQFQAHQRILAAGNFKPGEGMVMHQGTVTLLPEGATITVVEPSNPIALKERLGQIDSEILQVAFLRDRVLPPDARTVESADTQKTADKNFLAEMKRVAREMNTFANTILTHWAAFKGRDYAGDFRLDDNFDQENIDQHVQILSTMWDTISKYPTWSKAELKKLASQRNLINIDEVLAEIDAMPTTVAEETKRSRADMLREAAGLMPQEESLEEESVA